MADDDDTDTDTDIDDRLRQQVAGPTRSATPTRRSRKPSVRTTARLILAHRA